MGAVILVLLGVALLPLLSLAGDLLGLKDGLRGLGKVLLSNRTLTLLVTTIGLAMVVTTVALVIGIPLGSLLGKMDVAGGRLVLVLHTFPFFLPPFLLALGWFHILGQHSPLGSPAVSRLLFSPVGVIGTLGLAFSPVVTCLTVLGLRGINPSIEEAARTVARPARVVARILLPLARPAVAFSALVVFTLSISEIGVPMFLRVRTYPAMVFSRLGGIDYAPGEAFALVLPLLVIALALLGIERGLIGPRSFAALGLRINEQPLLPLGGWRIPASIIAWTIAALSLLPVFAHALRAGPDGFSGMWSRIGPSLSNSLLTALLASLVITALGFVIGHALARKRPASALLDGVAMLVFITPASVLGVGIVETWNRGATQPVYTSMAILVIGLVARYAIIGIRTFASAVVRSSPHYEEAAAAFGSRFIRRMTRVILPIHGRSLLATWLLSMIFCLRDLETVIVFYPPGWEPLPVRIFTLEANAPEAQVAALAILHAVMTAVVLVIGMVLIRARRLR
jgi:iron(III) transport system permease protein